MFWQDADLDDNVERELAEAALVLSRPSIEALFPNHGGPAKRSALHLQAALRDGRGGLILASQSWYRVNWGLPYDEIAIGKQALSDRTGLPSRTVQLVRRDLLRPGDIKFWGNAIRGPRIVSGSGVESYFDELASEIWLANWCALYEHRMTTLGEAREGFYYPS